MSFWQNVESASGFPTALPWVASGFIVVALAVFRLRPAERPRVRSALVLFVLALAGLLVAGGALSDGVPARDWIYLSIRGGSLFMLALSVVTVASVVIFTIVLRAVRLEPPDLAQDLILALVYIAIALLLLSSSGFDLRGVVATSAVITAVIGFALQDSLTNTIGGTILQLEQIVRVGDWIRVEGAEGRVKATRWRQTSIETRTGDTIIIPNSTLAKSNVTLLGKHNGSPRQQRQWVDFQVDLDHAPSKVIATVEQALRADPIPCVADTPKLDCLITEMEEGAGTYAVRYWLTDLSNPDATNSLIRTRVFTALHRASIELAIPAQSILLTEEKALRAHLEAEELKLRLTALQKIELFHSLTDEERQDLATRLINARFAPGEAITRQDAVANWLYVLTEGEAEVRVAVSGLSRTVSTLDAGDYFGEMGLMTGEPRTATVIALTDVQCYRLSKDTFEAILQRRPEIAEDISATLAHRRAGLEAVRDEASEEVLREKVKGAQMALLFRIRKFFALGSEAAASASNN